MRDDSSPSALDSTHLRTPPPLREYSTDLMKNLHDDHVLEKETYLHLLIHVQPVSSNQSLSTSLSSGILNRSFTLSALRTGCNNWKCTKLGLD
jgi:hypothetical protein